MTRVLTRWNRSVSFGVFRLQHESYPPRSVKNRSGRNYNTDYTRTLPFRMGVGNLPAREIKPKAPAPTRLPAVAHCRTIVPRCHCEERSDVAISRKGNENNRIRIPQTLTRGGSPPNATERSGVLRDEVRQVKS